MHCRCFWELLLPKKMKPICPNLSQYREIVIVKLLCSVLLHRAAGSHCRFVSGLKLVGIPAASERVPKFGLVISAMIGSKLGHLETKCHNVL